MGSMTEDVEDDQEGVAGDSPSLAAEVVAAAAGTSVGALLGGPAGAVAGAAMQPLLARALQRAGTEIGILRSNSAATALDEAARRLDRSADEVVDLATDSPESAQLLAETLFAAARTVNENKIRALARALANGLRDDEARPDEQQLIVSALAEVEAPHIKVLTHLSPERSPTRTQATGLSSRTAPTRGLRPSSIAAQCHLSAASTRAVLSVLQRAGMAVPDEGSEIIRTDRLIMEMQDTLNKVTDLLINPPKNGKIQSSKKPGTLKRPGRPATSGWTLTLFGQLCLDYLNDVEPTVSVSDAFDDLEGEAPND